MQKPNILHKVLASDGFTELLTNFFIIAGLNKEIRTLHFTGNKM